MRGKLLGLKSRRGPESDRWPSKTNANLVEELASNRINCMGFGKMVLQNLQYQPPPAYLIPISIPASEAPSGAHLPGCTYLPRYKRLIDISTLVSVLRSNYIIYACLRPRSWLYFKGYCISRFLRNRYSPNIWRLNLPSALRYRASSI